MPATVQVYNHTAAKFLDGTFGPGNTYKLMICSAATFDAANTTLAAITKTESTGGGYTPGGLTLTGVAVTTVDTDDAMFDADNTSITPSGTALSGTHAILYDDTEADDPPLALITFGETITADPGIPFIFTWDALGLFRVTKT